MSGRRALARSRSAPPPARAAPPTSPCPRSRAPGRSCSASKGDDVAFLPENTYAWSELGGWRKQDAGPAAGLVRLRRPRDVQAGREGEAQGLAPPATTRARAATSWAWPARSTRSATRSSARAATTSPPARPGQRAGRLRPVLLAAQDAQPGPGARRAHREGQEGRLVPPRVPDPGVPPARVRGAAPTASEGPHLVGGSADVTVKAAYYAGGGLASADVTWSVRSEPAAFVPPGRDGFVFGTWEPWWTHRWDQPGAAARTTRSQGKTDATGQHILHVDFLSDQPAAPDEPRRRGVRRRTSTGRRGPLVQRSWSTRRTSTSASSRSATSSTRASRSRSTPSPSTRRARPPPAPSST